MLKIENVDVMGWEAVVRGMRNPLNSWDKSDSVFVKDDEYYDINGNSGPYNGVVTDDETFFVAGPKDLDLMKRLRNAGTDHRKFMRMITVYVDITAPLYWWKEFDTYKVGTVANSCSTMHKIAAKEFTLEDFSHEHLLAVSVHHLMRIIDSLNETRDFYLKWDSMSENERLCCEPIITSKKDIWWQMIQLLPSSYNQKRTVMLNYEVLANMYKSRKNHKLDEWHALCKWIEVLPYSELITGKEENDG